MNGIEQQINKNAEKIYTAEVVMPCRFGLHARNAAMFLSFAGAFESDIRLRHRETEVNGKSVLGILMLGVAWRSRLVITVQGSDAERAIIEIEDYFKDVSHCADC